MKGSTPVVSSTGLTATHNVSRVAGPGVVTGRYGTIGSVFYVTEDFWPLNTTLYVKDFKGNDPRFVSYFLKTVNFSMFSDKAAVPGVNRNHLHKLRVRFPSPQEQRSIGQTLGALDDKIELNQRMSRTLEETARAIFKSWFVDFYPVRGTATIPDDIRYLFPDRLVDSLMGPIPEGWSVRSLGDEFDITMGQSPPGSTYNEAGRGLPFYQGRRDFGPRFPTQRVYCSEPQRTAEAGDVLLSVRAPVGDLNVATTKCCIGRGVAALRHRSGAESFGFHALDARRGDFDRFNAEGTVFGSVSRADLSGVAFLAPPAELADRFGETVEPLDELALLLERQIAVLAELRDALLPKLISGEVPLHGAAVA